MARSEGWGLTLLVVIVFIIMWVKWHRPSRAAPRAHPKLAPRPLKPRTRDDCPACRAAHPGLPPAATPPKEKFGPFQIAQCAAYRQPTDRRKVVIEAPWTDDNQTLTIQVGVSAAQARNAQGETKACVPANSLPKAIAIIGASSVLDLRPDPTQPDVDADADGVLPNSK